MQFYRTLVVYFNDIAYLKKNFGSTKNLLASVICDVLCDVTGCWGFEPTLRTEITLPYTSSQTETCNAPMSADTSGHSFDVKQDQVMEESTQEWNEQLEKEFFSGE